MTHNAPSALAAAQMRSALLRLSTRIAESGDESDVCKSVVEALADTAFGFTGVGLYVAGSDTFEPALVASAGAFAASADVAELKRPLRVGQNVIGELVVQRESGRAFDNGDVEILSAAANQASIALGHVRLLAAERTRTTEQRALLDTLTDLSSELQLDRLLQAVLERAVGLLGGLPLESYDALLELFAAPDKRLRLRDLGEQVVLTRSGVSRLVARLVDEGWVTRGTVDGDARGVYAQLTTEGEAAFRSTWPLYAKGISKFFGARMSVSEARQLAGVLERIR